MKLFVVVAGLPGSGKSTLAQRLAPKLNLPLIDKDTILEVLFDRRGTGDRAWRRQLSRESDLLFRDQALASGGAVLVSHWHLEGMPADSGTPTDWLLSGSHRIVTVHCACTAELAAQRMFRRKRHPGHCDSESPYRDMLAEIRAVAGLKQLEIGQLVEVYTATEPDLDIVARDIGNALRNQDG